jgi:hypothetical protein
MIDSLEKAIVQLEKFCCGKCGGVYALSQFYVEQKRQDGGYWNCPYCRASWGYGETEINRLKKKLEREKLNTEYHVSRADREQARANKNELRRRAAQGQVTKIKNRVGKGVCPCCKRTFVNLARHMQSKHPEYSTEV